MGSHLGLENLLGKAQFNALVSKIQQWAARNDGSQESRIAQEALKRAEVAGTLVPELTKRFDALSKPEQDVVKSVFKLGKDMATMRQDLLNSLGIGTLFGNSMAKMDGPYAPLMRFGHNWGYPLKCPRFSKCLDWLDSSHGAKCA